MVYFVGHFNIEDLHYPDFREDGTAGGACLYGAMGAYIWNRDIAVISRIGDNYPRKYLSRLEEMGVRLFLTRSPGPTMASRTEYLPGRDRKFTMKNPPERLYALTPNLSDVEVADIPEGSFVHLGPMNVDLLERILIFLKERGCFISLDTCDAFILENSERFLSLAAQANLFIPSRSELFSFPAAGRDLFAQIRWLAEKIRTGLVVKDSKNGSYVVLDDRVINVPIVPDISPVDLTGAGDAFCGGLLASLAGQQSGLLKAAIAGTVSSSYLIQQGGAFLKKAAGDWERDARFQIVDKLTEERINRYYG